MAEQKIKLVIQVRRDYAANWEKYKNIIPAPGEPCFIVDKNILKIGDGVTTFEKLEPINGVDFELTADGRSVVLEDNVLKLMGFDTAEVGATPTKNADGFIEWVVPAADEAMDGLLVEVDTLRDDVTKLQANVTNIQEIVNPSSEEGVPLLTRLESLENKMDGTGDGTVDAKIDAKINAWASMVTDGETIDTFKELVDYVTEHGGEVKAIVDDITTLQGLVGESSVEYQISEAIKNSGHISKDEAISTLLSKVEANAIFERVQYEITNTPVGTLVDYRDKEIRVMCPVGAQFEKQNVGPGGNGSNYYMAFKAYAPDGAVSFKEGDRGVVEDKMYTFDDAFAGTDEFGRNYSICWLALASYDGDTDTWDYYGKNSSTKKYIGWTYVVEWYDANGVKISSDKIRINLSNESCHETLEPSYITSLNYINEVAVNGTLLDIVDGRIDITIPEPQISIKGSDEIEVAEDGTLSIKAISFNKITQEIDDKIVLNGGDAAG